MHVGLCSEPVHVNDSPRDQGVVALVLIWELVALPLGAPLLCLLIPPCHTTHFRSQLREWLFSFSCHEVPDYVLYLHVLRDAH